MYYFLPRLCLARLLAEMLVLGEEIVEHAQGRLQIQVYNVFRPGLIGIMLTSFFLYLHFYLGFYIFIITSILLSSPSMSVTLGCGSPPSIISSKARLTFATFSSNDWNILWKFQYRENASFNNFDNFQFEKGINCIYYIRINIYSNVSN